MKRSENPSLPPPQEISSTPQIHQISGICQDNSPPHFVFLSRDLLGFPKNLLEAITLETKNYQYESDTAQYRQKRDRPPLQLQDSLQQAALQPHDNQAPHLPFVTEP